MPGESVMRYEIEEWGELGVCASSIPDNAMVTPRLPAEIVRVVGERILTLFIWLRSDQDNNPIFKLSVSRKNRFVDSLFDTTQPYLPIALISGADPSWR